VGGVRYDLPDDWPRQCRDTLATIEQRLGEYERLLEDNPFFLARAKGVGYITRELAEDVGVSGPLLRGSGVNFDLRRNAPYSSYGDFTFTVPVETDGDCFARYRVRMVEFRQSIAIVRQALDITLIKGSNAMEVEAVKGRPEILALGQNRAPA